MRVIAFAGLGIASVAAVGFAVVCWRLWVAYFGAQRHRCRYQRRPVSAPHAAGTLVTDDGIGLTYRWLTGRLPCTIVVAGGYRRCIEETFALSVALNDAGFSVLTFEFRGVRPGTHRLLAGAARETADLRAAIARARQLAGPQPLGVLGLCLGATAAVLLAADGEPLDALWLDGPFRTPINVLAHAVRLRTGLPGSAFGWTVAGVVRLTRGVAMWRVRADVAARWVPPIPVHTVVTEDDLAMPGQRDLARGFGLGDRETVRFVPGVRHAGAYFAMPRPYVAEAVRFFSDALGATLARDDSARVLQAS